MIPQKVEVNLSPARGFWAQGREGFLAGRTLLRSRVMTPIWHPLIFQVNTVCASEEMPCTFYVAAVNYCSYCLLLGWMIWNCHYLTTFLPAKIWMNLVQHNIENQVVWALLRRKMEIPLNSICDCHFFSSFLGLLRKTSESQQQPNLCKDLDDWLLWTRL